MVTALAAIGAAAFSGDPSDAARFVPTQGARPLTPGAAASRDHLVTPVGASAKSQLPAKSQLAAKTPNAPNAPNAVTISGIVPRAAVHTMSMDAPIQHGLTAHQEQALSARLLSAHKTPTPAHKSEYWTPAMGRSALRRAVSWLGLPYSWAGGNADAPTPGKCDPGSGGDLDCHVVGFDCSGLAMYAWGAYLSLPHLAAAQSAAGVFHPTLKQLLPGDLVFFSGYLSGGTGHVAIYAGKGMVIEAPQSGSVIRLAALADLIAQDGVYRGAVRPLTGQTPTLTAPRAAVPLAGGTVTLHGRHLASVAAVHVGGATVRRFARHSDSTIVFRASAHHAGTVAVTVTTPWKATSRPVSLPYARPRRVPVAVPKARVAPPEAPVATPKPPVAVPKARVAPPNAPVATPKSSVAPPAPGVSTTRHTAPPTSTTAPPS